MSPLQTQKDKFVLAKKKIAACSENRKNTEMLHTLYW
jgi:hypothetical protein